MSHIWMSHVTHVNESCHICEWVMSHIWMSLVTHMNQSCHMCEWVMSHIWMSHVTCVNEPCHTYEWVMSHVWMGHVTHMNSSRVSWVCQLCVKASRHTYKPVREHHTYEMRRVPNLNKSHVTYLSHVCESVMAHIWLSHVMHIHRKSSLYLLLSSVNLVLKLMGTPDGISTRSGFTVVVTGLPWNLYTKLTETLRQIKTTFPMNINESCHMCEWVVFRTRVSRMSYICHTNVSHISCICHTYVNESLHTHKWVMAHI